MIAGVSATESSKLSSSDLKFEITAKQYKRGGKPEEGSQRGSGSKRGCSAGTDSQPSPKIPTRHRNLSLPSSNLPTPLPPASYGPSVPAPGSSILYISTGHGVASA
eukprot:1659006-Rhodomonas_salina.1